MSGRFCSQQGNSLVSVVSRSLISKMAALQSDRCWAKGQHPHYVGQPTNTHGMAQELTFRYTHVEGGLVENVVLRKTTNTDTYPSGWKYTLHLGTLEDLTPIRYDNAHEDTKGTNSTLRLVISTMLTSRGWKSDSSSSGRVRMNTGRQSMAIHLGPTERTQTDHNTTPHRS